MTPDLRPEDAEPPIVRFDVAVLRRAFALVSGAMRRRWYDVALCVAVFTAVGVAAAILLPRTYTSEARVVLSRNYLMPALAHPGRAVPVGAEAPERSAVEFVEQRATLLGIVRTVGLVRSWRETRPPWMRLKDAVTERIRGPLSRAEIEDALVEMLQKRLYAVAQNEVLTIRAHWSDPNTTRSIVEEAQRQFLETRRRLDVQSIRETHDILQRSTTALGTQLEDRVQALRTARARAAGLAAPKITTRQQKSDELSGLYGQLVEHRRYREELQRQRRERLAALETDLAQQQVQLGERNPDLQRTRSSIAQLEQAEASDQGLVMEERKLERDYVGHGGDAELLSDGPADPLAGTSTTRPDDDEQVVFARALLRMDVDKYEDLHARLVDADLEMETARAAFPYRYVVVQPAERPHKPDSPNAVLVVVGALFAGLFSGIMVATTRDLHGRRSLSFAGLAGAVAPAGAPA